MHKQSVIILGGQGMLGQDLARVFADVSPLVWDRAELDITNAAAVLEAFTSVKPSIVINAAAYNLVDNAESDEGFSAAMQVNAKGPENIARACKQVGALCVHYSTDYVFEGTSQLGYKEDDLPHPQSRYAESKLAGERAVLNSDAQAYIIRTCRLFGAPGASQGSKQSFVDLMLSLAEKRDTLDVVNEEVASPTYSADLAAQTRYLIEQELQPGIYHITNSGACTWYEFAKEIFRITGKNITVNPVPASTFPRPAKRPAYSRLINTKLPPLRSWQEAVAAYLS